MNRQSVGLLLSALLLNTLGYGVLTRHAHAARLLHGKSKSHLAARDNAPATATPIPGGDLTGSINNSTQILGLLNATANAALVIDLKAGYIGVFDQSSSSGVIVKVDSQAAVTVSGIDKVDEDFLANVTTLEDLYGKGQSPSDSVQAPIQSVLGALSSSNNTGSAQDLVNVYQQVAVITDKLAFIGSGASVAKSYYLDKFVETIIGVSNLLSNADLVGGLQQNNASIPAAVIFGATSALDITGYTWGLLDVPTVVKILGSFTGTEQFVAFFSAVTGGNNDGLNAYLNVLKAIIFFIHADESFSDLITALKVYFANEKDPTVADEWKANIDGLLNLVVQLKIQSQVPLVYAQLQLIQKQLWIENFVDVSAITQVLFSISNSTSPQTAFINVLKTLALKLPIDRATQITGFIKDILTGKVSLPLIGGGSSRSHADRVIIKGSTASPASTKKSGDDCGDGKKDSKYQWKNEKKHEKVHKA